MLSLEEAQTRILAAIKPLTSENVPLNEAGGRFVAEHCAATLDLPPFDSSAMDGYAVRSADVQGAAKVNPVSLRIVGEIAAGASYEVEVGRGGACRVFTGSPLPRGADAVVMQEDTTREGDVVVVCDAAKPWEHVRLRGEDVKRGKLISRHGERIRAGLLALLAANGHSQIAVTRQPRVALLSTGDELIEPGVALRRGQIFENNRVMLASLVAGAGGRAKIHPIVRDSLEATQHALHEAFAESDFVVTTGGVSVGEHDYVKEGFKAIGGRMDFWRVAIRPGKPFVFGQLGEKLLLGLPGNPVSAFVTFLLLVRPALLATQGAKSVQLHRTYGLMAERIANDGERRHFVRVVVDATGFVHSAGPQASHMLSSLACANGLLDMPPKTVLDKGAAAQVLQWDAP